MLEPESIMVILNSSFFKEIIRLNAAYRTDLKPYPLPILSTAGCKCKVMLPSLLPFLYSYTLQL